MKKLNYFELIDKYTNDELDEGERTKFETDLIINSDLYEQFKLYNEVINQFEDKELLDFNQVINEVSDSYNKNKHIPYKFPGAVNSYDVIAILVFIVLGIFLCLFYFFYLHV